jgi:hypothetical protein
MLQLTPPLTNQTSSSLENYQKCLAVIPISGIYQNCHPQLPLLSHPAHIFQAGCVAASASEEEANLGLWDLNALAAKKEAFQHMCT